MMTLNEPNGILFKVPQHHHHCQLFEESRVAFPIESNRKNSFAFPFFTSSKARPARLLFIKRQLCVCVVITLHVCSDCLVGSNVEPTHSLGQSNSEYPDMLLLLSLATYDSCISK